MQLNEKQLSVKQNIEQAADLLDIDRAWALSIAMTESSLGINQKSQTGCLGIFQMSSIAMKDLHQSMIEIPDDMIDIVCGIAFLRLLLNRWGSIDRATSHFCDPKDRHFYLTRVHEYMSSFKNQTNLEQRP